MRQRNRIVAITLAGLTVAASAVASGGAAQASDPWPAPPGGISLWHDEATIDPGGAAIDLIRDRDGDIWYLDDGSEDLVRIDVDTHVHTAFDLPATTGVLLMAASPVSNYVAF